jgi:hypothetical protein
MSRKVQELLVTLEKLHKELMPSGEYRRSASSSVHCAIRALQYLETDPICAVKTSPFGLQLVDTEPC